MITLCPELREFGNGAEEPAEGEDGDAVVRAQVLAATDGDLPRARTVPLMNVSFSRLVTRGLASRPRFGHHREFKLEREAFHGTLSRSSSRHVTSLQPALSNIKNRDSSKVANVFCREAPPRDFAQDLGHRLPPPTGAICVSLSTWNSVVSSPIWTIGRSHDSYASCGSLEHSPSYTRASYTQSHPLSNPNFKS